jgi:hypothetical protein
VSDFRSIAAVTAALSQHLQTAVNAVPGVGGATVTNRRPDAPTGAAVSRINVFLLQVTPNASFRSADAPFRRQDGSLIQRPRAAVDLHYVISCYGDDAAFIPQILLGIVASALHARPVLTREMITATLANPQYASLATSDLGAEVERVKLTPMPMSLEELSRTWSVLFQTPYTLSVAYQAGVVFLDHPEAVISAPAVLSPQVSVQPGRSPLIESVGAASGGILANDSVLLLTGQRLRAQQGETRVRLTGDGSETVVAGGAAPAGAGANDLTVRLPLATHPDLRAGIQGVQVTHYLPLSDASPTLYPLFASDMAAWVLHPRVVTAVVGGGNTLDVDLAPPVRAGQTVQVELVGLDGAIAHGIRLAPPVADTTSLAFPLTGAPSGTWRVRARVEGAESSLTGAPQVLLP